MSIFELDNPMLDVPKPRVVERTTGAERVFTFLSSASAMVTLIIVGATLGFLIHDGWPAIRQTGLVNFLTSSSWVADAGIYGVGGLLIGTVLIAFIALSCAVPLSLGMALFINEYAPKRIRFVLVGAVDLLAALPSLIYGIWGLYALSGQASKIARWLSDHAGAIPLFRLTRPDAQLVSSGFIGGVVVAMMITPIITSVARDVMNQVPRELCEGALALGSTKWGMVRTVILPFGRGGIVGASLLGFGRALGETVAVAIIVSFSYKANSHVLERGAGSIASLIFTKFGEAKQGERGGLMAAGLALFVMTFAVSFVARKIVANSEKKAGIV